MIPVQKIWFVIPLWLMAVVTGFWWFEYRHWQSFETMAITFDGQDIQPFYQASGQKGKTTVLHFTDKTCPCSRYSERHIEDLQLILANTKQVVVTPPMVASIPNVIVPATPSVAIWNEQGELAYFGPYSSGAVCGEGKDFVSRVLSELQKHRNPRWINTLGVGCYCSYPNEKNAMKNFDVSEVSYVSR